MTAKRLLLATSLLLLASCACASDITRYRYINPVMLPEPTQDEELAQVLLTPEMFRVTQDNYADIRVIRDGARKMVPCLVECVTEERHKIRRIPESITLTGVAEETDSRLRITLTRTAKSPLPPLSGLVIKTPLRDFERHVQVEVSEDGEAWTTIVETARIFDVTSFADLRETDIPVPPTTHRHIRLTFNKHDQQPDAVTHIRTSADAQGEVNAIERSFKEEQRPFRVDNVDGWREESYWVRDERPLHSREICNLETQAPSRRRHAMFGLPEHDTWMFFDADRVPLESLTMDSPERILKTPYALFMEIEQVGIWRRIASGTLERVAFRDYRSERMTVIWDVTRANRYCLAVPGTAPTLSFTEAKGPGYRVVFPYGKDDRMSLFLGNPKAVSTGQHTDQIKMLMRVITNPLMAEPSPLEENPAWHGKSGLDINMSLILSLAIALTVIVLGFALATAMRRLPQAETE